MLVLLQAALFAVAREFRDANIVDVATFAELEEAISEGKWARGPWAGELCHHAAAVLSQKGWHQSAWQHNWLANMHNTLLVQCSAQPCSGQESPGHALV
jgi:hypothetical protein